MTIGAAIGDAVAKLSASVEKDERLSAENFLVDFEASLQLKIIQSVELLVKRRFHGIRETAVSYGANMGSPASFLCDLIPGVADW